MTRLVGALLAGILLTALTGCAPAADAAAPISDPPTPSPIAEPTPSVIARPTVPFGGSCEALVDEATLSDLVGESVVAVGASAKSERVWAVDVLGGLDCGWMSETDAYVSLDVIPAAGLEARIVEAGASSPYCYGADPVESSCSFSSVVGGYWFSGIVDVAGDAQNTAPDVFDALTARVAQGEPAPTAPVERPEGMWQPTGDCSTFGAGIDTTAILGESFLAMQGSRGGESTPGFTGALTEVGDFPCVWDSADHSRWFGSELLPGAGWAIVELAERDGALPLDVDGALAAVAVPQGGETAAYYATDGVNLAFVTVPAELDRTAAGELLAAVVAAASR